MKGIRPWWKRGRAGRALAVLAVAVWGVAGLTVWGEEKQVPRLERKTQLPQTLSSSGGFLAHGGQQSERAVMVGRAEEVRGELARLLDRQDRRGEAPVLTGSLGGGGARPLVINLWLRGDVSPPVQPRLYRVDGVPQPVLGVMVARAELTGSDDFRRELVRLMLIERMIRVQPEAAAAGRGDLLPVWLETGVMEALDHVRSGRSSVRFAALFRSGGILSVDDILTAAPGRLDGGAREVFALSAGCLVMALLDQPDGPARFRRFLEAVPGRDGSWQNLLVRTFPGLALSRHSLEKWWALQAVALATPDLLEPMSAAETEAALVQALLVRHRPGGGGRPAASSPPAVVRWLRHLIPGGPAPKEAGTGKVVAASATSAAEPGAESAESAEEVISLDELERLAGLPRRAEVMRANQAALTGLLLRAFPLHRPLIEEYQRVFGQLALGKTKGLAATCASLTARRREILVTAEAVTDQLNWYEATQRRELSGTFDRYFELFENPEPIRPRREADVIARTLDELEEEYAAP